MARFFKTTSNGLWGNLYSMFEVDVNLKVQSKLDGTHRGLERPGLIEDARRYVPE